MIRNRRAIYWWQNCVRSQLIHRSRSSWKRDGTLWIWDRLEHCQVCGTHCAWKKGGSSWAARTVVMNADLFSAPGERKSTFPWVICLCKTKVDLVRGAETFQCSDSNQASLVWIGLLSSNEAWQGRTVQVPTGHLPSACVWGSGPSVVCLLMFFDKSCSKPRQDPHPDLMWLMDLRAS